ncbi:MurR/RpiR family transcriptional regulator [Lacrimispora sp.]|uniref:MurR/RpiR family transcriptional regulator n=1 Tax=Lacrimispora sp. TaxID=2719234 RepID=UPI00345FABA0
MKSCTKNIIDRYQKLSYSEKIFADYVLLNKAKVIYMSVAELSNATHIAASTVISATKKLGYSGIREFKISLASEQLNPVDHMLIPTKQSDFNNIFKDVVHSNIYALKETLNTLNPLLIEQAVELLLAADTIHIYGIGTSAILAQEAYDFLFRLCLNCVIYTDPYYQKISIATQKENDVSLIISQSGVNREILFIADQIHSYGHKIIGISNYMGTPFSKYCNVLLAALPNVSNIHDNHFSFRIPILCIIETIYYSLTQAMGDRYKSALDLNQSIINETSLTNTNY